MTIAYFSTVTDDPDLLSILAQVEGAEEPYIKQLAHTYIMGAYSSTRAMLDFHRDCEQALRDARTIRHLFESFDPFKESHYG